MSAVLQVAAPPLDTLPGLPDAQLERCGDLHIDRQRRRLLRDGQPVALGARAFDLLVVLVDGRGRAQRADALRAAVWPGRRVGDNNLRVQLTHLRRVLGDGAITHRPGHGYQLLLPVQPPVAAQAAPRPAAPGNLPPAWWPLVGRTALRASTDALLQPGCRISLLGPGGNGKTALALTLAGQTAARFPGGAWWVDLAPLRDAAQVVAAVHDALGLPGHKCDEAGALDHLARSLAARPPLLLLLDNAEHLVAPVVTLCDRLLRAAPAVAVLCTSRVALRSAGEQAVVVPALSLPAASTAADQATDQTATWAAARDSDAVALLANRASRLDPRFQLTEGNAGTLLDICRQLEGHALGITLAASRLPLLGLQGLADALDQRLHWVQRATPGSAAAQHLSLQGMLDWTCGLLQPAERLLLRRLGVFNGHFPASAAAVVAHAGGSGVATAGPASITPALEALVQHGLVVVDGAGLLQPGGTGAIYTMHETTRLYAREQLQAAGETAAVRGALARHLRDEMHRVRQSSQPAALALAHALLPDVLDLVAQPPGGDLALAADLCTQADNAWRRAGQHHLMRRLAAPLLVPPADPPHALVLVELLLALCLIEFELDAHDAVLAHVARALRLLDPDRHLDRHALALSWEGNVLALRGDLSGAERRYRMAMDLYRRSGLARGVGESLNNLGWALQALGRADEARPLLHEARALHAANRDDWALMVSHENLAELELHVGQPLAALPHLEAMAVLARRHPDDYRLAQAQMLVALGCARLCELPRAMAAAREALQLSQRLGSVRMLAGSCSALALAWLQAGNAARAQALVQAARRLRAGVPLDAGPLFTPCDADVQQRCVQALSAADMRAADAQGALLTADEAIAWADVQALPVAAPAGTPQPWGPGRPGGGD